MQGIGAAIATVLPMAIYLEKCSQEIGAAIAIYLAINDMDGERKFKHG